MPPINAIADGGFFEKLMPVMPRSTVKPVVMRPRERSLIDIMEFCPVSPFRSHDRFGPELITSQQRLPVKLPHSGSVLALEIERHGATSSFTPLIFRFSLFLYGPAFGRWSVRGVPRLDAPLFLWLYL